MPGPRDPSITPYIIPFVRMVASRRKRKVILCISAQSGKTEGLLDVIGQRLDQRPVPILYVGPNKQFLTEQLEPRLMQLLDQSPVLKNKVSRHGRKMTKTRKIIAGVPLRLAHGGSSTALKSDPAGLAITDEADDLLANVKGQGDPIGLVDARGETYADFVHAIVSTPSVGPKEIDHDDESGLDFWRVQKDADDVKSTIWKSWQAGTRYHWAWKCPHCGEWFIPRMDFLEYDGKQNLSAASPAAARDTAVIACPRNGCVITEDQREDVNKHGLYVAPGQNIINDEVVGEAPDTDIASFWVSGLCTPFRTIGERAAAYVQAIQSGDQEKVQTVVNAGFGELWMPMGGTAPDHQAVLALRDPSYVMGAVPAGVLFLTAAVDVQGNRLVYVVRGWGYRQESWLIEHGQLFGDTRNDDVWSDLYSQVLDREFGPNGLTIRRCFIDSGFRPNKPNTGYIHKVYEFCRRHSRLCFATKGFDTRPQPISVNRIDVTPSGKALKFGLDLVRLDSDYCKSWVHARVHWPVDQPGGWHLPIDADEDYCRQIVSESRMRKPNSTGFIWVGRGAHDYLDAEGMAYAAAKMLGLDRLQERTTSDEVLRPAPPPAQGPQMASRNVRFEGRQGSWIGSRASGWLNRR